MTNSSGLKSLDKIGESPKVASIVLYGPKTVVVQLTVGWAHSVTLKHHFSATGIKDIWHEFRHNITACDCADCKTGVTGRESDWKPDEIVLPVARIIQIPQETVIPEATIGPPSITSTQHETGTEHTLNGEWSHPPSGEPIAGLICMPKGKGDFEYGHVWDGGDPVRGYIDLKEGDPCQCGKKKWTLPREARCTPMDHCYPSPPGGTVPKGTKCFCGLRRAGVEPRRVKLAEITKSRILEAIDADYYEGAVEQVFTEYPMLTRDQAVDLVEKTVKNRPRVIKMITPEETAVIKELAEVLEVDPSEIDIIDAELEQQSEEDIKHALELGGHGEIEE